LSRTDTRKISKPPECLPNVVSLDEQLAAVLSAGTLSDPNTHPGQHLDAKQQEQELRSRLAQANAALTILARKASRSRWEQTLLAYSFAAMR
jgi:hypothetical protein